MSIEVDGLAGHDIEFASLDFIYCLRVVRNSRMGMALTASRRSSERALVDSYCRFINACRRLLHDG